MSQHVRGIFPGIIPSSLLVENGLFICGRCHQLVSESHTRHLTGQSALDPIASLPHNNSKYQRLLSALSTKPASKYLCIFA